MDTADDLGKVLRVPRQSGEQRIPLLRGLRHAFADFGALLCEVGGSLFDGGELAAEEEVADNDGAGAALPSETVDHRHIIHVVVQVGVQRHHQLEQDLEWRGVVVWEGVVFHLVVTRGEDLEIELGVVI